MPGLTLVAKKNTSCQRIALEAALSGSYDASAIQEVHIYLAVEVDRWVKQSMRLKRRVYIQYNYLTSEQGRKMRSSLLSPVTDGDVEPFQQSTNAMQWISTHQNRVQATQSLPRRRS